MVLEKTLESPLDCKRWNQSISKGNQPWIFTGRTDFEAETPILWLPDVKNWLTGKDPDAGKDRGQEKGTTENETIVRHHWLNGHEFEQALGDSEGQASLVCFPVHGGAKSRIWLSDWTTICTLKKAFHWPRVNYCSDVAEYQQNKRNKTSFTISDQQWGSPHWDHRICEKTGFPWWPSG